MDKYIYNEMLLNGTLDDHVAEIDRKADEMFERLTAEMATREGITEQLKATNQMAWVGAMNNIDARVKEVIYKDLILAQSQILWDNGFATYTVRL